MTFYIFQHRNQAVLTDLENTLLLTTEAEAIDAAIRLAQEVGGPYTIVYSHPSEWQA